MVSARTIHYSRAMTRMATRIRSTALRVRGVQSRDRADISFAVLFMLALATGMALWDEMAFMAAGNSAGWTGVSVSAALCLVCLAFSRRRWPLLLCTAFLVSVRLTFVFAESVPAAGVGLAADCLGVCTAMSVIVFRTEIATVGRRIRSRFAARVSHTERAAALVPSA